MELIYCHVLSFYSYMVAMVIFSIYRSVFTDVMDYIHPINELILSKDNVQVRGISLLLLLNDLFNC